MNVKDDEEVEYKCGEFLICTEQAEGGWVRPAQVQGGGSTNRLGRVEQKHFECLIDCQTDGQQLLPLLRALHADARV